MVFVFGSLLLFAPLRGSTRPLPPAKAASQQPAPNLLGCEGMLADADGDGVNSERCGGRDCDDNDRFRYPGNVEYCDAEGHDEDCNPTTPGTRDLDRDGEDDNRCLNRQTLLSTFSQSGSDPDDNNPAIRSGSMVCDGADVIVHGLFLTSAQAKRISGESRGFAFGSKAVPCPTGTKCVVQPNGTGGCMVPPPSYLPAPLPTPRPPLPPFRGELWNPTSASATSVRGGNDASASITNAETVVLAPIEGEFSRAVALCKSSLQSGEVSWGDGMIWAPVHPVHVDKLCNGSTDAKRTIACFRFNVGILGWTAAVEKCK